MAALPVEMFRQGYADAPAGQWEKGKSGKRESGKAESEMQESGNWHPAMELAARHRLHPQPGTAALPQAGMFACRSGHCPTDRPGHTIR